MNPPTTRHYEPRHPALPDPPSPRTRKGWQATPLILSVPLGLLAVALLYLSLGMLVGWSEERIDRPVERRQQATAAAREELELGLERAEEEVDYIRSADDPDPTEVAVAEKVRDRLREAKAELDEKTDKSFGERAELYVGRWFEGTNPDLWAPWQLLVGDYFKPGAFSETPPLLPSETPESVTPEAVDPEAPLPEVRPHPYETMASRGQWPYVLFYGVTTFVTGLLLLVAFGGALFRVGAGLYIARAGQLVFLAWSLMFMVASWKLGNFFATEQYFDDYVWQVKWWAQMNWPVALAAAVVFVCFVWSFRADALWLYRGQDVAVARGDLIFEDVRTNGEDPNYRRSVYWALFCHFFAIYLVWVLLGLFGCIQPFNYPSGSGNPVVAMVKVVQPKKVVKKKYIFNPNSPISFYVPELEDSEIEEQVDEATELAYQTSQGQPGAVGEGGGQTGGLMGPGGPITFVRLKHGGRGWEDGYPQADQNFLKFIEKNFKWEVEDRPREHLNVRDLKKYPLGRGPGVIYITGTGGINLNSREIQDLRTYLVDNKAMLFADAGSSDFDRSFRRLVDRMFGRGSLKTVADDDPIFRAPNSFPNGPPPLWHHGGFASRQVRDEKGNRLVFYYPGDLNDAWKPGGGGQPPRVVQEAFGVGANIYFHGVRQYVNANREHYD